jgi:uracil-DNA glycosylase
MLLNRHLTTDVSEVGAHSDLGWAEFTDRVIRVLNRQLGRNLVAILWGAQAQELRQALCDCVVIASAHPSPLSARKGFFGSKPFSRTNDALQQAGLKSIDWAC